MDLHANMGTFCAIVDPWRVGWRTPIDFFPCSATSFQKHQLERPLSSPCSRAERFCGSSFAQAEHRHTLHSVKRLLFHSRSGKPPTAATISLEPTWSPSLFLYAAYLKAHRHNTITNQSLSTCSQNTLHHVQSQVACTPKSRLIGTIILTE